MYTLTVDDRELTVKLLLSILRKLDPKGTHIGATSPEEALRQIKARQVDVAFLDVEMPGEVNGLDLGRRLRQIYPKLNIVIITGHKEYAIEAFELDASGYLLKPITEGAVEHQLSVLRFEQENKEEGKPGGKVRIRCFGTFEVFHNGVPVDFSYSKSKELLACLVDRHGAMCSNDTMIGCLWPDEPANQQTKARIRKYVKDLRDTFASVGIEDIIRHKDRVGVGIDISKVDCDYYRFLEGDPGVTHAFNGKYMIQYSFAEETRAELNRHKQDFNEESSIE